MPSWCSHRLPCCGCVMLQASRAAPLQPSLAMRASSSDSENDESGGERQQGLESPWRYCKPESKEMIAASADRKARAAEAARASRRAELQEGSSSEEDAGRMGDAASLSSSSSEAEDAEAATRSSRAARQKRKKGSRPAENVYLPGGKSVSPQLLQPNALKLLSSEHERDLAANLEWLWQVVDGQGVQRKGLLGTKVVDRLLEVAEDEDLTMETRGGALKALAEMVTSCRPNVSHFARNRGLPRVAKIWQDAVRLRESKQGEEVVTLAAAKLVYRYTWAPAKSANETTETLEQVSGRSTWAWVIKDRLRAIISLT